MTGLFVSRSVPSQKLLLLTVRLVCPESRHTSVNTTILCYIKINMFWNVVIFCDKLNTLWMFAPKPSVSAEILLTSPSAPHSLTNTKTDKASAISFPAYRRIRQGPVLYLYAWLPPLCVICDIEQVSESLVGDELVVRRDNACVSSRRCVCLFLFPFQPPLLLQDFLPGNQTEQFVPPDLGLFYSFIHVTHSLKCIIYDLLAHNTALIIYEG